MLQMPSAIWQSLSQVAQVARGCVHKVDLAECAQTHVHILHVSYLLDPPSLSLSLSLFLFPTLHSTPLLYVPYVSHMGC